MELVELLGKNVLRLRRERRLSQDDLAGAADLDRSYISDLERGRRNPTVKALAKLANALGVQAAVLLIEVADE